jgi:hypothetical protein
MACLTQQPPQSISATDVQHCRWNKIQFHTLELYLEAEISVMVIRQRLVKSAYRFVKRFLDAKTAASGVP